MAIKPTLVLVPGAWHTIECWSRVILLLEVKGFQCVPVALPSTNGTNTATFGDDVHAVRKAIEAETTQGLDVVLVVHSYGGAVGQSAIKGFAKPKTRDAGHGYVTGLASMASGFGQTGISFIDGLGGKPPPSWTAGPDGYATLAVDPRDLFYHDVEDAEYWVSKLTKHSLKSLMEGGEFSYAGWKDVPVWYLATTEDHAFPAEAQMWMAAQVDHITIRKVASSHSPMLSRPKETTEFILEAVADFTK
ncbi:alpha beta-Hydrolase protein [Venturia nashicola]|nr:alpha beta-Hydrolase protein [Venturia nashicola]